MADVEPGVEDSRPDPALSDTAIEYLEAQYVARAVFGFLDGLRADGFAIGIDEYLEARHIVEAIADEYGDIDPLRLRNWMAAVFCGREEEQSEFYHRFDNWWKDAALERHTAKAGAAGAAGSAPGPDLEARVEEVIRQGGRSRWATSAALSVVVIVGAALAYERWWHTEPPPPPVVDLAVVIDIPRDSTTVTAGSLVTFSGSAASVDGDRTDSLTWSTDAGDLLGRGASVADSFPIGRHTITASVADPDGHADSASVVVVVVEAASDSAGVVDPTGPTVVVDQSTPASPGAGDASAAPTTPPTVRIAPPTTVRATVQVSATVLTAAGVPVEDATVSVSGDAAEIGVGWTDVTAVSVGDLGAPLTGHADGTVRRWTGDGRLDTEWSPDGTLSPSGSTWSVLGVAGHPSGAMVSLLVGPVDLAFWWVGSDRALLMEPEVVEEVLTVESPVAFSPTHDRVALFRASGVIDIFRLTPPDTPGDPSTARVEWERTLQPPSPVAGGAFSPDGLRLLTYGSPNATATATGELADDVWVLDVAGDSVLARAAIGDSVRTVAWSRDGRFIGLAEAGGGEVVVLDATTSTLDPVQVIPVDTVAVTALAFVEDGRLLAVGHTDGTVAFHRPDAPYASITAHDAAVQALLPIGDSLLATRAATGPARFWNVASLVGSTPAGDSVPEADEASTVAFTNSVGRAVLSVPIDRFERGVAEISVAHEEYVSQPLRVELAHLDSVGIGQATSGTLRLSARMAPLGVWWLRWPREHPILFGLLLFAVPVVLAVFWFLWRRASREAVAERRSASGRQMETGLGLERPDVDLYRSPAGARARIDARRYRPGGRGDLDADATVDAAVRHGGPFEPVYRRRLQLPAYLALVDRVSVRDQAAVAVNEFLDWLADGGVPIVRYYYDGDPRMCAPAPRRHVRPRAAAGDDSPSVNVPVSRRQEQYRSLRELASRYGGLRLLMFGDGAGMLSPVSGRVAPWTRRLEAWDERALMTPVAVSEWSTRESELNRAGLEVIPSTPSGLRMFVDKLRGLGDGPGRSEGWMPGYPAALSARPARWLDRSEPSAEALEELEDQLRAYLGHDGFRWLCSLAIYPELSWYLTLQLGMGLQDAGGEPVLSESRLLRLTRLPWLRHGRMPSWLREVLVERLSGDDEELIRDALDELLAAAVVGGDEAGQLHLARRKEDGTKRDWRRIVTDFLRTEPEDSPLHDYVFVSFLHNRRPGRLQVRAPKTWHRWAFERGVRGLGVRPALAVGGVALLSGVVGVGGPALLGARGPGDGAVVVEGWESGGAIGAPGGASGATPPPEAADPLSTPGSIIVQLSTTGDVPDAGGYTATVGPFTQIVATDDSVWFDGLAAGNHTVALSGVPADCTAVEGNARAVTVVQGVAARMLFDVTCRRAPIPPEEALDTLNTPVWIYGGTFQMGSTSGVPGEQPAHQVTVSGFWIQQHEVTNAEYARFDPNHQFADGQERYPAVNVNWQEAMDYASFRGGSLPTEAQWEFAARGVGARTYPWGDAEPTCQMVHYMLCAPSEAIEVMSREAGATPEGVHDLAGNVLEWTRDWEGRYDSGVATDPTGPSSGFRRVFRGGSFTDGPFILRGAYRAAAAPAFVNPGLGFRVAWSSPVGQP